MLGAVLLWPVAADASPRQLAGLDGYVEQMRRDWKNVGVAVAVVQGNELIYAKGFGEREFGRREKVNAETLFEIGSTTKAFTAAALGILVDEGRLNWDDPVVKYLPRFHLQDPWVTRHLTIRDALAHRTGYGDSFYPFLGLMNDDEAIGQLSYVTPQAEFRDSFRYNNLMYGVLGKIIEVVSGMTWQKFVEYRLLQPLKMNRSHTSAYDSWESRFVAPTWLGTAPAGHVSLSDSRDTNVAMPHSWDEQGSVAVLPWQSFDNAAPAGSIVSSASDMANWLIFQLNEGHFGDQQVLKRETLSELHAAQNLRGPKVFPLEATASYAMGWRRSEYRGYVYLAHGGAMLGFPAYVAMLPEKKAGVVVLSNTAGHAGVNETFDIAIVLEALDRLLGAPQHDWSKEFLVQLQNKQRDYQNLEAKLRSSHLQTVSPSLSLEKYAGVYEDRKGHSGPVSVRIENGQLNLNFPGQGAYSAYLEHWQGDLFRLHSNAGGFDVLGPEFAAFTVNQTGKAVALSIDTANLKLGLDKLDFNSAH
jgi:CubicO group peptidase (beta-lactamase class C family)